ncbi:MAG: fibronectin type III domain-containing protein [Micrococcales bacterium]|nr:fibronectin type III domain-containing protein [Micrococcales bacterium]
MGVQRLSNSGRSGFSYKSLIAGITPIPSVPTIGSATAVNFSSVNVAFTAPGAYAGSTYTATSSPGGFTGTSASSPILVSGLSELTQYTFTVTATNATGTSGASAASDPVTTPSGDTGVMYPIQMVSVGAAGSSSISFTSIPSTYKHLQIRGITRGSRSNVNTNVYFGFNNDTTTGNYYGHGVYGEGANAGALDKIGSATNALIASVANTSTASVFSGFVIDILDYASTSKNKTTRSLNGYDTNGAGQIWMQSGLWMNSSTAISSIQITDPLGIFLQYSSFALYGIKGA